MKLLKSLLTVLYTDACQSVIHWIDAVLLPTWNDGVVEMLTTDLSPNTPIVPIGVVAEPESPALGITPTVPGGETSLTAEQEGSDLDQEQDVPSEGASNSSDSSFVDGFFR